MAQNIILGKLANGYLTKLQACGMRLLIRREKMKELNVIELEAVNGGNGSYEAINQIFHGNVPGIIKGFWEGWNGG